MCTPFGVFRLPIHVVMVEYKGLMQSLAVVSASIECSRNRAPARLLRPPRRSVTGIFSLGSQRVVRSYGFTSTRI